MRWTIPMLLYRCQSHALTHTGLPLSQLWWLPPPSQVLLALALWEGYPAPPNHSQDILQHMHVAEGRVHENMSKIPSKISFTFDTWTSAPGDPYLSLMAHYIDAPIDRPSAWQLKLEQLIFQQIEGQHTRKNMVDIIGCALNRYQVHSKVGWFTSDGAAVNHTTLWVLQDGMSVETGWTAKDHDML